MENPTPYLSIAKNVSVILISGAALGWLALIVHKRLALGKMAPLQNARWFLDAFKGGLKIIRRCPWLLVVPLGAVVVQFCESLLWTLSYIKKNPASVRRFSKMEPEPLSVFLKSLIHDIPESFLNAASHLNAAMLDALSSPIIMAAFLVLIMVVLLRTRSGAADIPVDGLSRNALKGLGILSGLIGLNLLMVLATDLFFEDNDVSFWVYILGQVSTLLVWPFAYALLILSMDAADRESVLSFRAGLSKMAQYFRAMFCYVLIWSAVVHVALLPQTMEYFLNLPGDIDLFMRVKEALMYVLLAMISFVPVIVVVRRASFTPAFDSCIELWARHAKNAAVFLVICCVLLLIPLMLQGTVFRLFYSYWNWTEHTLQLFLALFIVTIGVLIMSSMVVFYKKIQESEEGISQEQVGLD